MIDLTPPRDHFCINQFCKYHQQILPTDRDMIVPLLAYNQASPTMSFKVISNRNVVELRVETYFRRYRFCEECYQICEDLKKSNVVFNYILKRYDVGYEKANLERIDFVMNKAIVLWHHEQSYKFPKYWINNIGNPVKFLDAGIRPGITRRNIRQLLGTSKDCVQPDM